MKQSLTFSLLLVAFNLFAQSKSVYLSENRFDLNAETFHFPEQDFNIIGFGAYHGSAKTEQVALQLIQSLVKDKLLNYYLPETDFSTAYFFNQFMETGDTILLKDLVTYYGIGVPQERTIEVYEKWKALKKINDQLSDSSKLKVVGIDFIRNYRYPSKHLLTLIDDQKKELILLKPIRQMVELDTTTFALGDLSYAYHQLKRFVDDYEANQDKYQKQITNIAEFQHLIHNLKGTFDLENRDREQILYDNYLALDALFDLKNHPQFLRIGFFHIEKSREGKEGDASFFTKLIENKIYPKEKVISIIGYLTESTVVWGENFDDEGEYIGYNTEAGFGIGDYEKEYFRGIQHLKDAKISDKTLFRLNQNGTPYDAPEPDLIEIVMTDDPSNSAAVKGIPTTAFLDYAVLISGSVASRPIFEMK